MNFYSPPLKDKVTEVNVAPDDTVAALAFSPSRMVTDYLASGTWSNTVSCYQVDKNMNGSYTGSLKASHQHQAAVLDVCWSDDGSKIFSASCDKTVKVWDLAANQQMSINAHDMPVRTVHWVTPHNCIMTTSWDRSMKFWDLRSQNPAMAINLSERPYCADVVGSMAVIATADRRIHVYKLDSQPTLLKQPDSPFPKFMYKSIAIFRDEKKEPAGYAVGTNEGRVAIQYNQPKDSRANFTFKCHRSNPNATIQDIYAVNDILFHPIHNTLITAGSDGKYSYWDKDSRTRLKISDPLENPVTRCSISATGYVLAYATGYDWSKGHEYNLPTIKNKIQLTPCYDDLKPKGKPR